MTPKYGTAAWRRRRRPIFMPNPSAYTGPSAPSDPYLASVVNNPRFRSATVQSFDATTWTATIQVTGSLASYLESVPVAKNLNAQLLTAGAKVGTIFFDDSNPTDAAVVAVYGAVPDPWVTSSMIVDATIATADIADLAVTTGKLADLGVTTAKIANLNVTTGKLNDLAVTTAKIDDLAVTTGKLAASAVTAAKCLANQANGVATIDSAGDLGMLPGDIYSVGYYYPGNQVTNYFGDNGAHLVAMGASLKLQFALYPSNQTTRYLYDTGAYTAVNAGFKAFGDLVNTGNLEILTSSAYIKHGSAGSGITTRRIARTTSVGTSATVVGPTPIGYGALCLVSGLDGSDNRFADLVLFGVNTATTIGSNTVRNSPATRTYTVDGPTSKLALAMGSGSYTVAVQQWAVDLD